MNNPDYISESSEKFFLRVEILKFFDVDPGSGKEKFRSWIEKVRVRNKHPGSATLQRTMTRVADPDFFDPIFFFINKKKHRRFVLQHNYMNNFANKFLN